MINREQIAGIDDPNLKYDLDSIILELASGS